MNKSHTLFISALTALTVLTGIPLRAATGAIGTDNMVSLAIDAGTEVVTPTPNWAIRPSLGGFHLMAQDMGLTGGAANQFYSLKGTALPSGDITGFTFYVAGSGAWTDHEDISVKLTNIQGGSSYSGLTSADPDLGTTYGPVRMYTIHHTTAGDWLTVIKTSSATASAVLDAKPMSGPGGTGTGYFGLTFSAFDHGPGANLFYYFRTDPSNQHIKFGSLAPALAGAPADLFDLGLSGQNALASTASVITTRHGGNQMYFLRLDPITGFTIFGTLNPISGKASDMANLGSVFSTLTFVPGDVGYGSGRFYTTGTVNPTWQSVSFASINDRAIATGSFNVSPSASSALPIVLTVVPGSVGAASIADAGGGVFTVTPTAPGLITLQATQAGSISKEYNMLRQSFTITGVATLAITTQPTAQTVVTGSTATFSVVASGTSTLSYQWRKAGINIAGNASATTATLSLPNAQTADQASYDVAVTNASGTIYSNAVTLTVTSAAPIITNSPLTAAGTVGSPFSFTITASGSPTSYSATPLPAGVTLNTATGALTGTPTTAGTTSVLLGATNGTGTGNATLTVTVAAAGVAPNITNSPLTAAGTVGSPFSFTITATGSPTSFSATPLPAGLVRNATTGVISGTPTTDGTTTVTLGATNSFGTGNATLTITVAAAGVAPVITNTPLTAAGTVGTAFSFAITATGLPTSFTATPLPAGLVRNATTGVISGTPTTAGTTTVTLGATNATGTGNATLTITIAAAPSAPGITSSPLTATGTIGTAFSFTITATDSPTSYSASPLPSGLVFNATTGAITGTPTAVSTTAVQLGATNTLGTGHATLMITVAAATSAPVVTLQPVNQSTTAGQNATFTVAGSGDGNPAETYQWQRLPAGSTTWVNLREGGNYTGVTTATLTVNASTPAMAGDKFRNVIMNASDFTASNEVVLSVTDGGDFLFSYPAGIARDSAGNFYVADSLDHTVRKITPAGVITTLAGLTGASGSQNGTGDTARFNRPDSVAVDASGNVFVSDTGNATIRKITPAGVVTTLAGTANTRGNTDATGAAASFGSPTGLALDSAGNLYVADTSNSTIRKVTSAGVVTTLAGTTLSPGSADGTGAAARFNLPRGVTVDASGNVFVADTGSATIRRITSAGVVTTAAGQAGTTGSADGLGSAARFNQPHGVAVDSAGNLYVADSGNNTIRAITPGGAVLTLAGQAGIAGLRNGAGPTALFNLPHALTVNADSVYVADTGNSTLRVISPSDVVSTMSVTTPAPVTATPVVPTTPATPAPSSSSGGGGGASSTWFLAFLALLGANRLRSLIARRSL